MRHFAPAPHRQTTMVRCDEPCGGEDDAGGGARAFVEEEMRVVGALKAEGLMKTLYRRAAGPGIVTVLEGRASTLFASPWTPSRSYPRG